MTDTRALILTTAGINCDLELARAFELAGAEAQSVHLNLLIANPSIVEQFDLIGIPGGFSYGDAIGAGRVAATLMRQSLYPAFVSAIGRGVPIFAPCNGFQMLCQMGLLPGPARGESWPKNPPRQTFSLSENRGDRFVDRWTRVAFPRSRSIWTRGMTGSENTLLLPNAHGEGRFVVDDESLLHRLTENGQVAVTYHPEDNFNGSMGCVAGICDASGLVLGLMPHPERYTRWIHHPFWTRLGSAERAGDPPGLQMFRNAIDFVTGAGRRRGAKRQRDGETKRRSESGRVSRVL